MCQVIGLLEVLLSWGLSTWQGQALLQSYPSASFSASLVSYSDNPFLSPSNSMLLFM